MQAVPCSLQMALLKPPFLFFFLLLLTKVLDRCLSLNLAATYEGLLHVRQLGLEPRPCLLPQVQPWTGHFLLLNLTVLICQVRKWT